MYTALLVHGLEGDYSQLLLGVIKWLILNLCLSSISKDCMNCSAMLSKRNKLLSFKRLDTNIILYLQVLDYGYFYQNQNLSVG